MSRTLVCLFAAALAAVSTACESTKSSNPLSPTVAGPIPGVNITPPRLLEPGQGWELETAKQPITLLIENASSNGVRPLFYEFEVATDASFTKKVFSKASVPQGPNGRTSLRLAEKLASGKRYYWRAKAQDGANHGPFTAAVSFEVVLPVVIEAPRPLSPTGGTAVARVNPLFSFRNAERSGPAGAITYRLEVALDRGFTRRVATLTFGETGGGTTRRRASVTLPASRTLYWRVRGSDPKTRGPWSSTQRFVTLADAPPSGGGGSGDSEYCGPPAPTTPLSILRCNRSKYPSNWSKSHQLSFLQRSARDFNSRGVSGRPFGVLRKTSGNNCGGYSCDIICTGQGTSQKQYDVLIDEDVPMWGSPKVYPNIRIDTCVIQ